MRALATLLVVAISTPAMALCIAVREHPVVINSGAMITADGGVVVATVFGGDGDDEPNATDTWVFDGDVKPTVVALAPGLTLLKPPPKATELREGKTVKAKITFTDSAPVLAAPKPRAVIHATRKGMRGSSTWVTVHLRDAVPADAIALVVFDAKGKAARSFAHVSSGSTEVLVYSQGRCSALPNGTVESQPNEVITLRWVDKAGRLSAPSKTVRIARGKPPV